MPHDVPRANILLVDDEPANLLALEAVLADPGLNFVRAASGEEALRHVLATDFAAVLMDVRMPGISGFETAKLIRARSRSRATPIIFITAADGDGISAADAYELGAVDYLTKPLVPLILRAKVAVFVELYRKTEALKAAERELVEARFQFVTDAVPALVSYVGPDLRYEFVNRGYEAWFSRPRAEVVGRPVREVVGEAAWAAVGPRMERALAGEQVTYEAELAYRDGGPRRVVATYTPDRDSAGRVRGIVVLVTDVSDLRRAEEAAHRAESRALTVLESISEGFIVLGPDWNFEYVNAAFERMYDIRREQLLDRNYWDVHPEARGTRLEAEFRKVRVTGETAEFENYYTPWDRWFAIKAYPAPGGGLYVQVREITDAKRAEESLRASEEEFRTTFERAGVGKAHADPETGRFVRVNPAFCSLTGYTADELLTMTIRDLTHPDERDAGDKQFRALVRGDIPQYAVEKRYLRKGGEVIWVRVTATAVRGPDGRPVRASAIIEDITPRKRAEDALAAESRRKDEFLATLAHELRNPLAPIRNALEIQRMAPHGGPAADRARAMIERQVSHVVRLVDDLLDVSRVSRGKVELRRERVSVGAVVEAALEVSRPALESARHSLSVSIPDEPLFLDADPVRLAQVVSNLLNNAAKYTPDGGRIELSVWGEDDAAVIRVADTGVGIAADALPHLFEMFSQVNKTLDRAQGGLGIGLALVKKLVELHGGTVTAESAGPGRGSTFNVRLPLAAGPAPRRPAEIGT